MSEGSTLLNEFLSVAFKACDGAKKILDSHYGNLRHVEEKFQAGLVSEADRSSEKFIFETILGAFPSHAILGEESGFAGAKSQDALWMIDPLDGTTNFVHRLPFFCISIGLEMKGQLVLGVVDAPKLGMRFHAIKGGGAFLNGEPIRVSSRTKLREALFATGFSEKDHELDKQMQLAAMTVREARGFRRAGAAALDLCFVAQGTFDVFWEKHLSPWDMAAGAVIATEAGAVVSDVGGRPFDPRGTNILCGSPAIHAELLRISRGV